MLEVPKKQEVINKIYKKDTDIVDFLRFTYKSILINSGERELYNYFSEIYDEIFTDILLKKLEISLETRKMLEILSTPVYLKNDLEKRKIYEKLG